MACSLPLRSGPLLSVTSRDHEVDKTPPFLILLSLLLIPLVALISYTDIRCHMSLNLPSLFYSVLPSRSSLPAALPFYSRSNAQSRIPQHNLRPLDSTLVSMGINRSTGENFDTLFEFFLKISNAHSQDIALLNGFRGRKVPLR